VPKRSLRILSVLGWFFLVSGAITLFGHVVRPSTARIPVLGKSGGWILDAMSLGLGAAALLMRKELYAQAHNSHHQAVWDVLLWQGGRLRAATVIGVPAGIFFGLGFWLLGPASAGPASAVAAVLAGVLFGAFFGGAIALSIWKHWPGAAQLDADERVAVVRAVRLGEGITDPRLAPLVIEYSGKMRHVVERDRRQRWVLFLFGGGTAIAAVVSTVVGSTRTTLGWWLLVVVTVIQLIALPRIQARRELNAKRAEMLAREALEGPQD
jgi:hypothetical protein